MEIHSNSPKLYYGFNVDVNMFLTITVKNLRVEQLVVK